MKRSHLTRPTDGAGGNPWLSLGVSGSPLTGNLKAGSAELEGPGPARAREPGLEKCLHPKRHPLRALHRAPWQRAAEPQGLSVARTSPVPQPSSRVRVSLPALPPRCGPRPTAPAPRKMDSLSACEFERWTVNLERPARKQGPSPSGHGVGDHPPPQAAASQRPWCGRWAH